MSWASLIPPEVLRQLQTMSHSRLELFMVEAEEVRDRTQLLLGLAVGLVVFALLAGLSLTAALVMALWSMGPMLVLTGTGILWAVMAIILYVSVFGSLRRWRPFAASYEQLRKDRALLMEHLP